MENVNAFTATIFYYAVIQNISKNVMRAYKIIMHRSYT